MRSFARTCIGFGECPGLQPCAGPAYDTNMPNDRQYSESEWLDSAQAATLVESWMSTESTDCTAQGHRITAFHPVSLSSWGLHVS